MAVIVVLVAVNREIREILFSLMTKLWVIIIAFMHCCYSGFDS